MGEVDKTVFVFLEEKMKKKAVAQGMPFFRIGKVLYLEMTALQVRFFLIFLFIPPPSLPLPPPLPLPLPLPPPLPPPLSLPSLPPLPPSSSFFFILLLTLLSRSGIWTGQMGESGRILFTWRLRMGQIWLCWLPQSLSSQCHNTISTTPMLNGKNTFSRNVFFYLQTGLCCYLLLFLGAPLMGPPGVVNNTMEEASRYINTQVRAGDYTSFYANVFHRASASRKKRFSSSSSYCYYY